MKAIVDIGVSQVCRPHRGFLWVRTGIRGKVCVLLSPSTQAESHFPLVVLDVASALEGILMHHAAAG